MWCARGRAGIPNRRSSIRNTCNNIGPQETTGFRIDVVGLKTEIYLISGNSIQIMTWSARATSTLITLSKFSHRRPEKASKTLSEIVKNFKRDYLEITFSPSARYCVGSEKQRRNVDEDEERRWRILKILQVISEDDGDRSDEECRVDVTDDVDE